jgi:hypothetical protein
MERGGIYGRSRTYPHTGGRVRRVFRTCIHISFRGPDFCWSSENAKAFNKQALHVLLAYEIRPTRYRAPPPKTPESMPSEAPLLLQEAA